MQPAAKVADGGHHAVNTGRLIRLLGYRRNDFFQLFLKVFGDSRCLAINGIMANLSLEEV